MKSSSLPTELSSLEISRHLLQFLSLCARHPVKLGIRHCNGAEPSQRGDQRLLFVRERFHDAGIYQNCTLGTRSTKWHCDECAGRRVFAEMRRPIDVDRDPFTRADGSGCNLQRRAQVVLFCASANGCCELRLFRRNCTQLKQLFVLHKYQHCRRMQQLPKAIGDAFQDCGRVGRTLQGRGNLHQNRCAPVLFARKLAQAKGLDRRSQVCG